MREDRTENPPTEKDTGETRLHAKRLERDMNALHFRAKYVSASENGDYYPVAFENTDPAAMRPTWMAPTALIY
jgi:hypothetical protein